MEVLIVFNKRVYWDNWGHIVTAFKAGDKVVAEKNKHGYSAESPYWPGITDIVYLEDFDLIEPKVIFPPVVKAGSHKGHKKA